MDSPAPQSIPKAPTCTYQSDLPPPTRENNEEASRSRVPDGDWDMVFGDAMTVAGSLIAQHNCLAAYSDHLQTEHARSRGYTPSVPSDILKAIPSYSTCQEMASDLP